VEDRIQIELWEIIIVVKMMIILMIPVEIYKKSRTVKQLWRSQLNPSCGKRCRFLRCQLEIAIESIVRKASYDSDFIRSVGAGADGILNSGK